MKKRIKVSNNGNSKIISVTLLGLLLLLIAVTNYWVLHRDTIPPLHDANVCYSSSFEYYRYLVQDFEFSHLRILFSNINFYPPLYMLVPLPFYIFNGPNSDIMAMVNILYLVILIWSIYKLGNFVYGKPTGLFSAIIILTFPSIIGFSRITHVNIALTATLTLSLYTLLKSENFCSRKFSVSSGIIAGLGCLFSSKYLIYFIGPVSIYLLYSLFSRKVNFAAGRKDRVINLIFFLFIAIFISALYYVPANLSCNIPSGINPEIYNFNLKSFGNGAANFKMDIFFLNITQYLGLLKSHILMPNFVLFLLAAIISIPTLLKQKNSVIFFGWFLFPISILSFFAFNDLIGEQPRFLLPVLPSVAVIIAGLFSKITKIFKIHFLKIGTLLIVMIIGLTGIFDYIFFLRQHLYPRNSVQLISSRPQYGLLHAVVADTPVSQLFTFLDTELAGYSRKVVIITIFEDDDDTAPLVLELIYDQLRQTKRNIKLFTPMGLSVNSWRQWFTWKQNKNFVRDVFESADYILYIENNKKHYTMGRPEEYRYRNNTFLKELLLSTKNDLKLIWQDQGDPERFFTETLLLFRPGLN